MSTDFGVPIRTEPEPQLHRVLTAAKSLHSVSLTALSCFTSSAGAELCAGAGQRAQPVGGDGAAAAPGPGRVRPRHGQHPEASARGAAAQGAAERGRPQDALQRVRPRQIRRPEHGGVPACDARVWRAALQWRGAAHLHALRQRQVRQVPPYGFAPPHTGRC